MNTTVNYITIGRCDLYSSLCTAEELDTVEYMLSHNLGVMPHLGTRPPRELVHLNISMYLSLLSPPTSPGASTKPLTKDKYSKKVAETSSKPLECFETKSSSRDRVDFSFL